MRSRNYLLLFGLMSSISVFSEGLGDNRSLRRRQILEEEETFFIQFFSMSFTDSPSISNAPTVIASSEPTIVLSDAPTVIASSGPTVVLSNAPTVIASSEPTVTPTVFPSLSPTKIPTSKPSSFPSNTPSSESSVEPTLQPTIVVSTSPSSRCNLTPTQRELEIREEIFNVSPTIALLDESSPQFKALDWIVDSDEAYLCPDDPKLVQRYVMALLYYSTGGDGWSRCSEGQVVPDCVGDLVTTDGLIGTSNYLSPTSECEWGGSTCDVDGCITRIGLQNINMVGTIPFELEQLDKLTYLGLEEGQLSGTIPTQLGTLLELETFDVNENLLTGTIPEEIYGLLSIRIFDLDSNQLTGTISNDIGNFVDLQLIQVQRNFLTGTIPASIGDLDSLRVAEFFSNDFTGQMPEEVCEDRLPPFGTGLINQLTTDCAPDPNNGQIEIVCTCCSFCFV